MPQHKSVGEIAREARGGRSAINIVESTTGRVPMIPTSGNLMGLVMNTTGAAARIVSVPGVLTKTTTGTDSMRSATVEKNVEPRGKTQAARLGQVPYAGRKY